LVSQWHAGVVASDPLLGCSIVLAGVDSAQPNKEVFVHAPSVAAA